MEEKNIQIGSFDDATYLTHRKGQVWLSRLCGMLTGNSGEDTGPVRTQGMSLIRADDRRYEARDLVLENIDESENILTCRWKVGETLLRLITVWQGCPKTGVVSRCDKLINTGDVPIVISRYLARVSFPPGKYEIYSQMSRHCGENQGAWQTIRNGQFTLRNSWGCTTLDSTPYLAFRAVSAREGLAFHVLPQGNWIIRVGAIIEGSDLPFVCIELGMADENLHRTLKAGETFELPEILIHPLPEGEPHLAAPILHHYLLDNYFKDARPEAPVIYNAWFDQYDYINPSRLREQMKIAKELGCEVLVVDAGWFGRDNFNWWGEVGYWHEKTNSAFCGEMRAFADEVREAGMGFGLWMEPERFGEQVPILSEHPEWFIRFPGFARIDLTQPAAYSYLHGEIERLIETYKLEWFKLDMNFIMDADASGAELYDYYAVLYRLLDEVRTAHPETFFEGCCSGGRRFDINSLRHFDGNMLSDNINPMDELRIYTGAALRLPPGRINRWMTVRSVGKVVEAANAPVTVLAPGGSSWEPAETTNLKFALLSHMPGMLGLSCDLINLTPEHRTLMQQGISFYKQWRRFITKSVVHLLTPPETIEHRTGWVGFQFQQPEDDTSLVFVYKQGVSGASPDLKLYNLDPDADYLVRQGFDDDASCTVEYSGAELMNYGLSVHRYIPIQRYAINTNSEVFAISRKIGK